MKNNKITNSDIFFALGRTDVVLHATKESSSDFLIYCLEQGMTMTNKHYRSCVLHSHTHFFREMAEKGYYVNWGLVKNYIDKYGYEKDIKYLEGTLQ